MRSVASIHFSVPTISTDYSITVTAQRLLRERLQGNEIRMSVDAYQSRGGKGTGEDGGANSLQPL